MNLHILSLRFLKKKHKNLPSLYTICVPIVEDIIYALCMLNYKLIVTLC